MGIRIERLGNLTITVAECKGEKFYSLDDILKQTEKKPAFSQQAIRLNLTAG